MYIDVAEFLPLKMLLNKMTLAYNIIMRTPEENRIYMREWHKKNPDYAKKYREAHAKEISDRKKKHYYENVEENRKIARDNYWKKRDARIAVHKDYMKRNPLRHIYDGIKNRCYCPSAQAYSRYGGRGIKMADRWLGCDGFCNFVADMGERPGPEYTVDRIDNNGDYSPENCRWATSLEQGNNKRNNKIIKGKTISEWSRELGISYGTLISRYHRGWSDDEIISNKIYKAYERRNS